MKKLIALMLCLVLALSMSVTAFAEGEQTGTTTLTAEVPEASYTIHIPANVTLEYGNTEKQTIGDVYVTGVAGYNEIYLQTPYTDLINTSDSTDTISLALYSGYNGNNSSYTLWDHNGLDSVSHGRAAVYSILHAGNFQFDENGYAIMNFYAQVSDWSGATAGATYQSVVTFNFKVE